MTDTEPKTLPDSPAVKLSEAPELQPDATPPGERKGPVLAPSEKEPFNPFKFQSITMPPGLRAEIIEHARNRPPEAAPEDTLPPNHGVALNSAPREDDLTIRLVGENLDTERVPRVLLARAKRRRQKQAMLVAPILAALGVGLAVWSFQRGSSRAPSPDATVRAASPPPTGSGGLQLTATPVLPSIPKPADRESRSGAPSVSSQRVRPRAAIAARTEPSAAGASGSRGSKAMSSNGNGIDLLDFEGPAPK